MGTTIRSHQVPADDYNVSESMRQTRDEEVQAIAEEAYRGAYRLLTDHRDLLDEIAERLLDHEAIEREEIQALMEHQREPGERPTEVVPRERDVAGEVAEALASEPPDES
jgi:cell division protease FtsH